MIIAGVVLLAVASGNPAVADAHGSATIIIRGPTIIAFFAPVSERQLEKDSDTNEALADFQLYASQLRQRLRSTPIEFHEVYTHLIRIRRGNSFVKFHPSVEVGYYFVAPGK